MGLTIAAIIGSTGTSAIQTPNGLVNLPDSSIALRENKNSIALIIISLGGLSIQSNLNTLSIPKALSWRMKSDISDRISSGGVVGGMMPRVIAEWG
jgi:hypothetical protein